MIGASRITALALPHLIASRGSVAYLSSIAASSEIPPRPAFAGYVVSKAALDKLIECWRVEHPAVGFTRVVVGDCMGGEGDSRVELSAGWDEALAGEIMRVWVERGYIARDALDVRELIAVVESVLRCRGSVPSIAVTPRPAA